MDRKGPPEWFERVGDGGFHTEPESDTSDGVGEGGPYVGECGESRPDDKTWWEWLGESEGNSVVILIEGILF